MSRTPSVGIQLSGNLRVGGRRGEFVNPFDRVSGRLQCIGASTVPFHDQPSDHARPPPNLHLDLAVEADAIQLDGVNRAP